MKNETKASLVLGKSERRKRVVVLVVLVILVLLGMASCNVTRTVTTQSQYYQKGDTSIVIQTKTIETYDASKKQ